MLGIDNAVSDQWGRMSAIRPLPAIDGLLAATALTNGLTLVTRNDRDVAGLGAKVLNPFGLAKTTIDHNIGGFEITRRATGPDRRIGGPRPTMMSSMSAP